MKVWRTEKSDGWAKRKYNKLPFLKKMVKSKRHPATSDLNVEPLVSR